MLDILDLMKARHSVRRYTDEALPESAIKKIEKKIEKINEESGLDFKLVVNEPEAFGGLLPKYGSFRNVHNYIICAGDKTMKDFEEKCGYYGEELVLLVQSLGLNSCWVGLTANRKKVRTFIPEGETLNTIIAIGYGEDQGHFHKNKPVETITNVPAPWPEWFKRGMMGAMLAPTAVNQQHFKISLTEDGKVSIVSTGGFFSKVDLGIVKCQFELAAGEGFPGFSK